MRQFSPKDSSNNDDKGLNVNPRTLMSRPRPRSIFLYFKYLIASVIQLSALVDGSDM